MPRRWNLLATTGMPRRWQLFAYIVPVTIVADQVSKVVARANLPVDGRGNGIPIPVIENYWDWILAYNKGSAFSMLASADHSRVLLSLIGLLACGAIVWMVHKAGDRQTGLITALALMAGGAVGNLIDRIAFGQVTDFILWRYHDHRWPVFNIADVALSVAVVLFLAVSIRDARARKRREPAPA